jgi:predicted aminopeptidase
MATVSEEREAFKIRMLKPKAGFEKVTIVNHTEDTTITCTVAEGYRQFCDWIAKGKGQHNIHVVYLKKVKEAKLAPGTQTKFTVDCGTNDLFRQVAGEWERILAQVKNLTIARHLVAEELLASLKRLTTTEVAKKIFEGEGEIPDWMK